MSLPSSRSKSKLCFCLGLLSEIKMEVISSSWKQCSCLSTWRQNTQNVFRNNFFKLVETTISFPTSQNRVKVKRQSYPCTRPWRPIGLWVVDAPTFSEHSANTFSEHSVNTCRGGCQPHIPAALSPQEDSWYSFVLYNSQSLVGTVTVDKTERALWYTKSHYQQITEPIPYRVNMTCGNDSYQNPSVQRRPIQQETQFKTAWP
jgi:hypothetical protein